MLRLSWISAVSFGAALLLSTMLVDHGLVESRLLGPGLTTDESLNIPQGVFLVEALAEQGPLVLTPAGAQKVFGSPKYLSDYPPLARMPIGVAHWLTSWCVPGSDSSVYNVPAARLGSCFAFAVTVLLLTEFCKRRYGWAPAVCGAILMVTTPSLIGHARIASSESATNLAWIAAMLPLLSWWTSPGPPSTARACITGVFWGLLLLTKVQGILLPPIVFLWAVRQYRWQSLRPLCCWLVCGMVVFLACWPWLWLDPINNLLSYFGSTTKRATIYCWYFGERFADKDVPWHYPFVLTLFTLPLGTLLCLAARGRWKQFDRCDQLLLLSIAIPLTVFALPGTPVYDGNRLFLIVMPSIILLAARCFCLPGDEQAVELMSGKALDAGDCLENTGKDPRLAPGGSRPLTKSTASELAIAKKRAIPVVPRSVSRWQAALLLLLALQPFGSPILQPFALCQYGPLAGGANGAAHLGMEASYWGDGLNGTFWEQVPENSTVFVAPVSHQSQLQGLMSMVPIVQQRQIKLVAYEYDPSKQKGLLLLIHRLADLRPELRIVPPGATVVAESRLGNVVLARLIDATNVETP